MTSERTSGLGKCRENHPGAYGYPSRPEAPYDFCAECGTRMVWECPACSKPLPEDAAELERARFCRDCGASYFELGQGEGSEPPGFERARSA